MPITKVSTGLISSEVASTNLNIDDNTLFIDVSTNRVGVGNLVPSTALDVTGTVTADGLRVDGTPVRFVSTAPMLNFMESGVTDSNHRLRQNFGNFVIQKLSDDEGTATDRLLIDGGTGDISFYENTGTSPKFFWDASAESLGIGTTSPVMPLDVMANTGANALSLRTRVGDDFSFLIFRSNDGAEDLGGLAINRTAASTSNLLFYTNNNGSATERMRLDSSGRQLIGYTSSVGTAYQTNLQVKGSSASNYGGLGVISTNNEMLGVVGTWSNGENSLMIAADPDNLRPSSSIVFTTDASERMRISSDGSISTQTLGTNNLRLGANAGNSIVSGGDQNVLVGDEAGTSLTTGDDNVAIGYSSLATEDTGGQSTAVGAQALRLQNNDGANYNTAVGYNAGGAVTTGTFNTLIGGLAGDATTTASSNTAIGYASFSDNITGAENVAVGKEALGANTTASENTAVGHQAGFSTTTGTANAVFGHKAWYGGTGNYNSVFGHTAYRDGGAGNNNAAFGYASMSDNTGNHNSAFGNQSVQQNTSGTNNTGVGSFALFSNTTASNNTAVGYEALLANTTGSNLTAVGRGALDANTTGNLNVAVGTNALGSNTVGDRNVAIGDNALQSFNPASNVDSYNVAVGLNAGISLTTGTDNTFIGGLAGEVMTTGSKNTILGRYNGNQGGLDIRTSSNYIVLSDGDGNPRQFYDATYNTWDLGSSDGIARAELFNAVTVADDSTLTITNSEAGAMLLSVYDTGLGKGALFFATYSGLTSILASSGDFAISDSDGNYCVYKSTSSHTITFKNRTGASRNIAILAIGAKAKKN